MQVIINKDFSVAVVEPSAVFQNSQNASTLSVFAPFSVSQYGLIELYVTLPNGEILPPYVAFGNLNESEIAQGLGTWSLSLDSKFTQLSGRVVMSLAFYGGTPEVDLEGKPTYPTVATTGEFSVMILPSVTGTLPATPNGDVYEQILTEVSTLISRIGDAMTSLANKTSVTVNGVIQQTYDASDVVYISELSTALAALKQQIEQERGYDLVNGAAKFDGDVYANVNKLLATTEYVQQQIAALVNGAPETLDTLKELGDAIAENESVINALNAAITNKLDKIPFNVSDKNKTVRVGSNGGLVAADVSYISTPEGMEFFSNNGEEYRVASYTGSLTDIIIPNTCNGKPITVIDTAAFDGAYSNNTLLTSVVISEGIKRIENGAFASQTNLKSITIPHSVNFIANTAFSDTGIKDIYLPWSESEMTLTGAPWGANAILHYAVPESIGALQKYANNTFANALKGKVIGEAVAMKDVSPVEHTLKVSVSGVNNFSNVKVKKYGKNLFDDSYLKQVTFTASEGDTRTNLGYEIHLPAGEYAINVDIISDAFDGYIYSVVNTESGAYISNAFKNANGTTKPDSYIITGSYNFAPLRYSLPDDAVIYIYDAIGAHTFDLTREIFDKIQIQLEVGTTATAYEPYIAPTEYPVNADGTVDGVTSIPSGTTLLTDTAGAVITAEYNRDINKAFEELYNAIISLGGNV
jgi:hypothetical protein